MIIDQFCEYTKSSSLEPLFICGDSKEILRQIPDNCVDFCMTSPPYWSQREYHNGGIGEESTYHIYIDNLMCVFEEVKRVLKPTGSFWLNIGDTYQNKCLVGIPWRVALNLSDDQGWILRNSIVWNKLKGGLDQSKDKLRNVHEMVFHFVKSSKGYYYDVDAIKSDPRKSKIVNGAVVSATGVSGVRYRRQIELSTSLSSQEKISAIQALEGVLDQVRQGLLDDFRMVIRGQHRTTHSDSAKVSGRAKELAQKGFYFLKYDPKGTKPTDVWEIIPEDRQKRSEHYAAYPEALCNIPIIATCPLGGLVLDPFCGTGTTNVVAKQLGRKSVGIDLSPDYISAATKRVTTLL